MSCRIRSSFYRGDRLKWIWVLWLTCYSILLKQEKMVNSSSKCGNISLKKGGAMKEKSQSNRERNVRSKALQVRSPDLILDFAASILASQFTCLFPFLLSCLICQMKLLAAQARCCL